MCGYTRFQAGLDYAELPETSNAEYSYISVPNITVTAHGDNSANNLSQVNHANNNKQQDTCSNEHGVCPMPL